MKSALKFIGLTVITCGLYLVYRILKLLFRLMLSPFRTKRRKDAGKQTCVIRLSLPMRNQNKPQIIEDLKGFMPFISKKELAFIFKRWDQHYGANIHILLSQHEWEEGHHTDQEFVRLVHNRPVSCCGNAFFDHCECGIEPVENIATSKKGKPIVTDYMILPNKQAEWRDDDKNSLR